MCVCFSLMAQPCDLEEELGIGEVPDDFLPVERFYPGRGIPVVGNAEPKTLDFYFWGLIPPWAKDIKIARSTFNARSETLAEKPSFRNAFRRRRCLIPATGYFETDRKSTMKQSYHISIADQPLFTFAGLWEYAMDPNGNEIYSAAIITCPANRAIAPIHDRMPVILAKGDRDFWLADHPQDELQAVLLPYEEEKTVLTAF